VTGKEIRGVTEYNTACGWVKVWDWALTPNKRFYDQLPYEVTLKGNCRAEWTEKAHDIFAKIIANSTRLDSVIRYLTPSLFERMMEYVDSDPRAFIYDDREDDFLAFHGLQKANAERRNNEDIY
jgi:hypothetical protein